jgi:uncharacterized membrane protein
VFISGSRGPYNRLPEVAPQVPRPRIQGLSDLIFGLALSVAAISFGGSLPSNPQRLTADLLSFGFTFLILISVWNRYTTTTSVMPVETPVMIRLNMILLFLVAIEPFLFDVLYFQGLGADVGVEASLYYGLDIGGMNLILAYFTHLMTSEEKKLVPESMLHRFRVARNLLLLTAGIFLASTLPVFGGAAFSGLSLRVVLWICALPIIFIPRLFGSRGR